MVGSGVEATLMFRRTEGASRRFCGRACFRTTGVSSGVCVSVSSGVGVLLRGVVLFRDVVGSVSSGFCALVSSGGVRGKGVEGSGEDASEPAEASGALGFGVGVVLGSMGGTGSEETTGAGGRAGWRRTTSGAIHEVRRWGSLVTTPLRSQKRKANKADAMVPNVTRTNSRRTTSPFPRFFSGWGAGPTCEAPAPARATSSASAIRASASY